MLYQSGKIDRASKKYISFLNIYTYPLATGSVKRFVWDLRRTLRICKLHDHIRVWTIFRIARPLINNGALCRWLSILWGD